MESAIQVGIVGDFNPSFHSHLATNVALQHAAGKLNLEVESRWLPTASLLAPGAEEVLAAYDGLWASAGSPYRSMQGMLRAIKFARERDWPLMAT